MSQPVIGLTSYNSTNKNGFPVVALMRQYLLALEEAGALTVVIPSGIEEPACRAIVDRLDGLLLTGGGDIGVDPNPLNVDVDPSRDLVEFGLLRGAINSGKPFLGICRGLQVINVALGGSLFADIAAQYPGALKHDHDSATEREFLVHTVEIHGPSKLASILGEDKITVNSLHHQGIKDLARDLHLAAQAPDGLVEGVELPGHPFGMGVQWHPEWLTDQPASQKLFGAFVKAAEEGGGHGQRA
jgi:putative glutamine amidotransferase